MRHHESIMQISCVKWFRYQYPNYAKLLVHIPNGGSRDLRTAQRLKAEGVISGVPDLMLTIPSHPHHALFVELKVKPNRQSATQKEWQGLIEAQGYAYKLVYSFDEFQQVIQEYIGNIGSHSQTP